jgi:hypothetical protein
MNERELWKYFGQTAHSRVRFLGKEFIWLREADFSRVRGHFRREFNMLHPDRSMRSRSFFRHLHAVMHGPYVSVHWDTGNLARFWPLAVIHACADVLPFKVFELLLGKPVRELYGYPPEAEL